MGYTDKAGNIQGVCAKFNNSHNKVIATYGKNGKPVGWAKTFVDSIDNQVKYSFHDKNGIELYSYQGSKFEFVKDYALPDDKYGFHPFSGRAGESRSNLRFSSLLIDGSPVIGRLTFKDDLGDDWTLEGQFNSKA